MHRRRVDPNPRGWTDARLLIVLPTGRTSTGLAGQPTGPGFHLRMNGHSPHMFTIIGLIALLGAVTVGVAGIQANSGSTHALPAGFTVFDHTYHGSTGLLFAYGILIGAIGTAGFLLMAAGIWTTSRRGAVARRELRQSRREMAAARKELTKPAPAVKPAGGVKPRKPVVPLAKTDTAPKHGISKPNWSFTRLIHRPGAPAKTEPAAK